MYPPRLHREAQGQRPLSHVLEEARETERRKNLPTDTGNRLGARAEGFWLVGDLTPGGPCRAPPGPWSLIRPQGRAKRV